MKRHDRTQVPWLVEPTEIFEAAFYRRLAPLEYEAGITVIDLFERQARVDPRLPGVHHEDLDLWIHVSPRVGWLPQLVLVYTFDEERGVVDLWNLYRL